MKLSHLLSLAVATADLAFAAPHGHHAKIFDERDTSADLCTLCFFYWDACIAVCLKAFQNLMLTRCQASPEATCAKEMCNNPSYHCNRCIAQCGGADANPTTSEKRLVEDTIAADSNIANERDTSDDLCTLCQLYWEACVSAVKPPETFEY